MLQALLAALLFGASAPLSKLLLSEIDPIPLAGFLYLGSGMSLFIIKGFQRLGRRSTKVEAHIQKADLPWLAGAILAGGIVAPIGLLLGLRETPAATASLLLNFEAVATTLIAALVFREAISRRAWWAIAIITTASILLSTNLNGEWGISLRSLGILAACLFWGLDNNFTRNISAKDPLAIVTVKGLVAGLFSLVLAHILGNQLPDAGSALRAMLLGSMSYGLSIVLFVRAMRGLGAARTGALFGTAPLAGIALSFMIFRDALGIMFFVALPCMAAGMLLLMREEHEHTHAHAEKVHDHRHRHDDEHHIHEHPSGILSIPEHSHFHGHPRLEHEHHHLPDIHHRHTHPAGS